MPSSNFEPSRLIVPQLYGNAPIVVDVNPDTGEVSVSGATNVKVAISVCASENGGCPIFSRQSLVAQPSAVPQDELTINIRRSLITNVMEVTFHTKSSPKKCVVMVGDMDPVIKLRTTGTKEDGHHLALSVSQKLADGSVYYRDLAPLPILPAPPKKKEEVAKKENVV